MTHVRVWKKFNGGVILNKHSGIFKRSSIIRSDIYKKGKKFYIAPIYIHHFIQKNVPERLIKPSEGLVLPITDEYTFIMSLFVNDIIQIQNKAGSESQYYFYHRT